MNRLALATLAALAVALAPRPAGAYCRAMSCDAADASQECRSDAASGCVLSGEGLFWAGSCVSFSVQRDGAPRAGISYDAARASLERALDSWLTADCGGQPPALAYAITEPVSCDASEYNRDRGNANIVMFREGEWPYEGGEDALGITRVRFDLEKNVGELYDADIELNAVDEPLSVGAPGATEVDLDSLMTHEIGHALGLAHSVDVQATMRAGYTKGTTDLRSPNSDDVAGICSVYGATRGVSASSCSPRHGFAASCGADQPAPAEPGLDSSEPAGESKGCSLAVPPRGGDSLLLLLTSAFVRLLVRRRSLKSPAQ